MIINLYIVSFNEVLFDDNLRYIMVVHGKNERVFPKGECLREG
jgi:hypothetical protein